LLAVAAARLARGQLLTPAGDSAREYIDRATRLGAANPAVLQSRAALGEALAAAARATLTSGDIDAATRQIEAARSYGADAKTLAPLERSLAEADRARAATRNTEALAVARERIRQGQLLDPAEDAAMPRLATIQKTAADTPGLDEAWTELVQALATGASTAIAAGNWASADKQVAALKQTGRADAIAATLGHDATKGRLQQEYLATPVPAGELKLASSVAAVYPPEALRSQMEGWVDLEYIVDRDGRPRDVMALQAEPRRRFEQAAIAAINQYRYEPFVKDGDVYERRVRLRMRFSLQ
jgi:protein TonB